MAEAFAKKYAPPDVEIISAGIENGEIHSFTKVAMAEAGYDIKGQKTKVLDEIESFDVDVVVTLCEELSENCPMFPGTPASISWSLKNPAAAEGSKTEVLGRFRIVRDEIHRLVRDFFGYGYFETLIKLKDDTKMILNNMAEGIIIHDLNRKILHFNRAAEAITGYRAWRVIGRNCHDVFPGGFCGDKCNFCEDQVQCFKRLEYPVDITTSSGDKRRVEMSVVPINDQKNNMTGVMASFKDVTRVIHLEEQVDELMQFQGIVGRDQKMLEVYDNIADVASSDMPVMITGETGTGKELAAAAIHELSGRKEKLFVPVNCAALPEGTIESELFGHVKGAFTGAIRDKKGRFELADGGTIFLDEVGDLSPAVQVKLLRVLQEHTVEKIGGEETIKVDTRVVSATNKNLKELIKKGKFREDLYYRLCVVPIVIPPLRDRAGDIPLIARHILNKLGRQYNRLDIEFSQECRDILKSYDWPGNVRQLQNAIQYAFIKCKGVIIKPRHLPEEIISNVKIAGPKKGPGRIPKLSAVDVANAMKETGGNKSKAARILKVGRATLYRFLEENKE